MLALAEDPSKVDELERRLVAAEARASAAEAKLRETDARHRLLIESWAQAVWETDANGMVVTDSPSWRAYTGQTLEEWLGYGWLDAIHPDDRAYAELQWREAVCTQGLVNAEFRLRAPEGGWRWTNVRAAPLLDPNGNIQKWLGLNIDIHDRKLAEAALRESEERYRQLFTSMDEAYAVVEVLKDGEGRWTDFRFLEVNQAFLKHTTMPWPVGKTATELLGSPNPQWTKLYGQALDAKETLRVEEPEATLAIVFDLNIFSLDRERNQVAVLFTNITERKEVEAALRESEELFRTLADTAPALIWLNDAEGKNQFINRHFVEFTGKSPGEIAGDGWHTLIHPVDAPNYVADYLAASRAKRDWQNTVRIRRYDGVWRWFENHAKPVLDAKGLYAGHVGVSVDVTDRVLAERTLRGLQERQAFLLQLSDALRPIRDAWGIQSTTTLLLAEYLQADRAMYAEVEGAHGAETGRIRGQYVRHADNGEALVSSFPSEFSFDQFGAHTMAARYRGEPLVVADVGGDPAFGASEREAWQKAGVCSAIVAPLVKGGQLVAEFGVHCARAREWTEEEVALVQEVAERTWAAAERARAEAKLRESEERLGLAVEIGALASWDWDLRSGEVSWNDRHFLMQGYAVDEVTPSLGAWVARVHPDDRSQTVALIEEARDHHRVYVHDFRSLHPDGEVRWCSARGSFFYDDAGAPYRMIGVMEDITDRKLAEDAVRESEERFRQFGEASQDVLWIRDAETMQWTYLTPAFEAIYGLEREQALSGDNYRSWLDLIEPEDRQLAMECIARARAGEHVTFDYRIKRPVDGSIRWLRNTDFPIVNERGEVNLIGGIGHDITKQREAEERQKILLAELQHRVRNILAVTRSIISRSDDGERSAEEYVQHLQGRIAALARTQVLLTRRVGAGVDLEEMIRDELLAQVAREEQFALSGRDIELSPKAAEVLSLAIHELATNATKYGAFSRDNARLRVQWRIVPQDGEHWLELDWVESGVPIVEAVPRRQGFGSELISRRIPYELKGTGNFTLKPGGLRSRITFPLRTGHSILQIKGVD